MKIQISVRPSSRSNEILIDAQGGIKIKVTAAPEDGKANDAVILLLSDFLHISKSSFQIIRGHTSKNKLIDVHMPEAMFKERIASHQAKKRESP